MRNKDFLTEDELVDFGWNDIEPKLPKRNRRLLPYWILFGLIGIASLVYFRNDNPNFGQNSTKVNNSHSKESNLSQSKNQVELGIENNSVDATDQGLDRIRPIQKSQIVGLEKRIGQQTFSSQNKSSIDNGGLSYFESQNSFNTSLYTKNHYNQSVQFSSLQNKQNAILDLSQNQENKTEEIGFSHKPETQNKTVDVLSPSPVFDSTNSKQSESVNNQATTIEPRVAKPKTQYSFVDLHGQSNQFQNVNFGIGVGRFLGFSPKSGLELSANVRYGNEQIDQFAPKEYLDTTSINFPKKWNELQVSVPVKYTYQLNKTVSVNGGVSTDYVMLKNPKPRSQDISSGDPNVVVPSFDNQLGDKVTQISVTPTIGVGINYKSIRIDLEADALSQTLSKSDTFLNYQPNMIRLGVTMPLKPKR